MNGTVRAVADQGSFALLEAARVEQVKLGGGTGAAYERSASLIRDWLGVSGIRGRLFPPGHRSSGAG